MDPDKLVTLLADSHLWLVLGTAFVFGALGAVLHRISTPQATPPPDAAPAPRLGQDLLSGGIAAVAILYVTGPATGAALVGGALVAGYAAKAVMASLAARVTSAIEASKNKQEALLAKRDLMALTDRVVALPEALPELAPDKGAVTDVKRFARDLKAQALTE